MLQARDDGDVKTDATVLSGAGRRRVNAITSWRAGGPDRDVMRPVARVAVLVAAGGCSVYA